MNTILRLTRAVQCQDPNWDSYSTTTTADLLDGFLCIVCANDLFTMLTERASKRSRGKYF